MANENTEGLRELRGITVPENAKQSRALVDLLIKAAEQGQQADIDELIRTVVGSQLETINILGNLEREMKGRG